jgi:hypothetical protein
LEIASLQRNGIVEDRVKRKCCHRHQMSTEEACLLRKPEVAPDLRTADAVGTSVSDRIYERVDFLVGSYVKLPMFVLVCNC